MRLTLLFFSTLGIGVLSFAALFTSSTEAECLLAGCSQQDKPAAAQQESQPLIACSLTALNEEQRMRQASLRRQMSEEVKEIKEMADGYAFRFPSDTRTIVNLAEFISLERLCCPFFKFELAVEGGDRPVWLKLSGGAGVKEFLRAEFVKR